MVEQSIRDDLKRLRPTSAGANAGLWLDRFLPEQLEVGSSPPPEGHPHAIQFKAVAAMKEPRDLYKRFYERWEAALADLRQTGAGEASQPEGFTLRTGIAKARSRVVVGLGAEGVLENAVTLNRAYGVPYVPGSALKGVAAAYARRRLEGETWKRPALNIRGEAPLTAHEVLFGSTRRAGMITFFDALYTPKSGHDECPLAFDVLTVHHPDYYNKGDTQPPADWDNPTPITFVSATGCFLVALAGPKLWLDLAWDILALGLDELGIGGKTAAGYGRMDLDGLSGARGRLVDETTAGAAPQDTAERVEPSQAATPAVPLAFAQQIQKSSAGSLPNLMGQWRNLPEPVRPLAAQLIIDHARAIKVRELENKAWYKELLESTRGGSLENETG